MGMEIHRHELEHAPVFIDTAFKLRSPLVGSEGYRGRRAAFIVKWNGESVADAKAGGLLKQPPLRLGLRR
jgi:hypothetical protein